MKRKYDIQVTVTATIEIDDEVLDDAMSESWQKQFWPVHRREDVVEHVGFNMLRECPLSMIDGFAHMKDEQARIVSKVDWSDWLITEIPPPTTAPATRPKKRGKKAA